MGVIKAAQRFTIDNSNPASPTIRTTAFIGGNMRGITFGEAQESILRTMRDRKAHHRNEINRLRSVRQHDAFPGLRGPVFAIAFGDLSSPQITTSDTVPGERGREFSELKRTIIAYHRSRIVHADQVSRGVRALTAGAVDAIEARESERLADAAGDS